MKTKILFQIAISLFSFHNIFAQIPQKDSSNSSNIRFTPKLQKQSLMDSSLLKEAKSMGINVESNAYKRILSYILPIKLDQKSKNYDRQTFFGIQEAIVETNKKGKKANVPGWNWYERGPNNVGGRTRAFMFDPNDNTNSYKKVWAGSVAGGLWFNNDITNGSSSWNKVNDFWDNLAISCITYDPQNKQKFYVGTGEGWYNIDAVQGAGIFLSIDGGTNWSRLPSTIPNGSGNTESFKFVQKIVVNNAGEVFAATHMGILKSTDSGSSWNMVLKPSLNIGIVGVNASDFISDLEIGSDGILFSATNSGKVFKSTNSDGLVWQNITPIGVPNSYRTEIGLAENNSGSEQGIYVVSAGSSSDVWMRKSVDGGANWANVNVPSIGIENQGWYDLILKVHPTNSNVIYAGAVGNLRSIDGGSTWSSHLNIHTDHHNFIFRPGTNEVVNTQDGGVYYSSNWGDVNVSNPAVEARNNGFNVTQMYCVAQKNIFNDGYTIGGTQDNGTQKISSSSTTIGSASVVSGGDGMLCFIDQNEPNIQIGSYQYLSYYLVNGNGNYVQSLLSYDGGDFINPADYDDIANILYVKYYNNGKNYIKKVVGVGSTNTDLNTELVGFNEGISYIKVAKAPNTIFIGTYSGNIYKVSNMDATTAMPVFIGYLGGSIGCIDIGETDNIQIATIGYYNTSSIFYTNNGGANWINKDIGGIPNVPVRHAAFFPYDNKKVVLATDIGVFYTPDITQQSLSWTEARADASGTNIGNVSAYWLKFRKVDGMLAVATHGRGIYFTDYFKNQLPLAITLNTTFLKNCPAGTLSFSFDTQGDFQTASFIAQLSNANGDFTSPINLGSVTPFTANNLVLPNNLQGSGFKLRITSSSPSIFSNESNAFEILEVNFFANNSPSLVSVGTNGAIVKLKTNISSNVFWVAVENNQLAPSSAQILNGQNGSSIKTYSGSFFMDAGNANRYLEINTLPSNSNMDLYFLAGECISNSAAKIDILTTGSSINYCPPAYNNGGCANYEVQISSVTISKGNTVIAERSSLSCTPGSYGIFLFPNSIVSSGDNLTFSTVHNTSSGNFYYYQNLSVWADYNRNGSFEQSEQFFTTNSTDTSPIQYSGNFTIPNTVTPGFLRIRFRSNSTCCGQVTDACGNYAYGETEDYIIWVESSITTNPLSFSTANQGQSVEIPFSTIGAFNSENTFGVQFAPTSNGVFVNQVGNGSASPLQATVHESLAPGEYIARVVSSNPVINGKIANTPFIVLVTCPPNIDSITGNITGVNKYETNGSIISTQTPSGNAQIIYDAGSFTELNPGFDTSLSVDGYLIAHIDGCGGALRKGIQETKKKEGKKR